MAKGKKVYMVEVSQDNYRKFYNWPDCQAFVSGRNVFFASGKDEAEALAKLHAGKAKVGGKMPEGGFRKKGAKPPAKPVGSVPKVGICSDAGTHGNPGPCELQVCDLNGHRLFHKHLGVHTNNYAEMAGILEMIKVAIEKGETQLYTDSKIAMGWIKKGTLGPTVHEPQLILAMVHQINDLLRQNPQLKLLKWHTREWGEIPADFGRK